MRNKPAQHPMGVVTRKTGLRSDVIRAWERRHGAVRPSRTAGRHRLYSDADIRRLLLIRRAIDSGWQIGQIAPLQDEEIRRLLAGDSAAWSDEREPGTDDERIAHHMERCLDAIKALDADRLTHQLEEAAVELGRVQLLERLLAPTMEQVGQGCADGRFRPANEHLASAALRAFLESMRAAYPAADGAPGLIVTTPVFQHHELGAMLVAATARSEGWRTTYLGPNLPAEEIAAAARQGKARAVALSITSPRDDENLDLELRRLQRMLPDDVTLVVGGRAAGDHQQTLAEIGARRLPDLATLRSFLNDPSASRHDAGQPGDR